MAADISDGAQYDVIVVGSGAGGLSTAITARKNGLSVIVLEKEPVFGGTTAVSGGVLWIPLSPHMKDKGVPDTRDAAIAYMKAETGEQYSSEAVELFLDKGPEMLAFFEKETEVRFIPTLYPDYHPDRPGGVDIGRSVLAAPYDTSVLGPHLGRLRKPLWTITFMGMMFNSSNADIRHFFNVTKSFASMRYVAARMIRHFAELLRYGRGVQVTSGNALAARLAKSAIDLGIPIVTSTRVTRLVEEDGRVSGVEIRSAGKRLTLGAGKGVVLACGGFSHDHGRIARVYPHMRRGGEHFSPVPEGNAGDGIAMAEALGAEISGDYPNAAAWMPVSKVPAGNGKYGAFPHLLDRYKPGVIGVLRNGKRFTNESNSYHDVGEAMIAANVEQAATEAWLICDHKTIRKYGLGIVKPAPLPVGHHIRSGYIQRGRTLASLAAAAGIDADNLVETVETYNRGAKKGEDPQFGRGRTAFNRYLADAEHSPNPAVGPIEHGPFYALKLVMGDLGTFEGLKTTLQGQVLRGNGEPVRGLFAVGNDRASIMGGNYPGAGITLGPAMTFGYVTGRHLAGLE